MASPDLRELVFCPSTTPYLSFLLPLEILRAQLEAVGGSALAPLVRSLLLAAATHSSQPAVIILQHNFDPVPELLKALLWFAHLLEGETQIC